MVRPGLPTLRVPLLFWIGVLGLFILFLFPNAHAGEWDLSAMPEPQFEWVDSKGEKTKQGFPAKAEWVSDAQTNYLPRLRVWIGIPKSFRYLKLEGDVKNIQENLESAPYSPEKFKTVSFDTENTLTAATVEFENNKNVKQDAGLVVKAVPQEVTVNLGDSCDRLGIHFAKVPSQKPLVFLYFRTSCREDKESIEISFQYSADIHNVETDAKGSVVREPHLVKIKFPKSLLPKEPSKEPEKETPVAAAPKAEADKNKTDPKKASDPKNALEAKTPPAATPTPPKEVPESLLLGRIKLSKAGSDAKAEFVIMFTRASEGGWHFSVSMGPSYLKYSESLAGVNLTQIGLTGKLGATYSFKRSRFFVGTSVFGTLLPLTHSPSLLEPTRFWGLNLDGGMKLGMSLFGLEWRFITGAYFWGMMVPGNAYGLKLLVGPKAVLAYRKNTPGKRTHVGYLKYAPIGEGPTSLNPVNFEMALGTGFQLNSGTSKRPWLLTFDFAFMNFKSKTIPNAARLLSASSGIQVNF